MKISRMALWIIVAMIAGYLLLLIILYSLQSSLMYHPVEEIYQTPSALGLDFEDIQFKTQDGVVLHGWFVSAPNARGTVLFSHGNAGNISGRLETLRILHSLNMNVLMYDYQGYGKSEGRPSEEATYQDASAAWSFLTQKKDIPARKIIVMGRSLGGAVSARLASEAETAGLILESTFTSAKDLAVELYPMFPVRLIMKFDYPTQQYLRNTSVPLLVMHSRDDKLIPFDHGRELYKNANGPKSFFEMEGGHGGGHIESGNGYIKALDEFLNSSLTIKIN